MPEVDLVMGPHHANRLGELLDRVDQGNQVGRKSQETQCYALLVVTAVLCCAGATGVGGGVGTAGGAALCRRLGPLLERVDQGKQVATQHVEIVAPVVCCGSSGGGHGAH